MILVNLINNTLIYIHFSNFEYNNSLQLIYTVKSKEKMNQTMEQANPGTSKSMEI